MINAAVASIVRVIEHFFDALASSIEMFGACWNELVRALEQLSETTRGRVALGFQAISCVAGTVALLKFILCRADDEVGLPTGALRLVVMMSNKNLALTRGRALLGRARRRRGERSRALGADFCERWEPDEGLASAVPEESIGST